MEENIMTANKPVLDVLELRKDFTIHAIGRHVEALKGISLNVGAGEHVALIGQSGAGKSTLLRCVWRSYRPTSGHIWLHRRDHTRVDLATAGDRELADSRRQQLGYVGQFLRAEPRRSVLEVVARAGVRRGAHEDDATDQAVTALREVAIGEDLWGTSPVVLSGGEQQ